MTELLLNALWLAVSGVVFVVCSRQARKSDAASVWRAGLALACVVVLLFPVISATDDLYAAQFQVEDATATQRVLRSGASGVTSIAHHAFSADAALLSSPHNPLWRVLGSNNPDQSPVAVSVSASPLEARSPPVA